MSIGRTTIALWRRSLPWRIAVICAAALTVLALLAENSSRQIAGSTAPSGPASGNAGLPSGVPSSSTVSQQCGPQGQLTLQAPIVVSPSGSLPPNVQSVAQSAPTQGSIPAPVLSRFRQFITRVDAANLEQRLGERCVRMNGALEELDASDFAYADCFQDGEQKLVVAQSCSGDYEASETRFARLLASYEAISGDASASAVEELARARQRMLPFDETRERWGLIDTAVSAGDQSIATIEASDRRIAVLEAINGREASSLEELERFAAASELTAFDRSRLAPETRITLERAEQAKSDWQRATGASRISATRYWGLRVPAPLVGLNLSPRSAPSQNLTLPGQAVSSCHSSIKHVKPHLNLLLPISWLP
jgi:hypothetical protein